jgi:hypothetical protein
MLLEAARDPSGTVQFIRTGTRLVVQTNDNVLADPAADGRSEANGTPRSRASSSAECSWLASTGRGLSGDARGVRRCRLHAAD